MSSLAGQKLFSEEPTSEGRTHAEGSSHSAVISAPLAACDVWPSSTLTPIPSSAPTCSKIAVRPSTPVKSANAMLSAGWAEERPQTLTSRSGWAYGSGLKMMASATVNVVVVTPIPSPRVSTGRPS